MWKEGTVVLLHAIFRHMSVGIDGCVSEKVPVYTCLRPYC
jgi:hypothetical protein